MARAPQSEARSSTITSSNGQSNCSIIKSQASEGHSQPRNQPHSRAPPCHFTTSPDCLWNLHMSGVRGGQPTVDPCLVHPRSAKYSTLPVSRAQWRSRKKGAEPNPLIDSPLQTEAKTSTDARSQVGQELERVRERPRPGVNGCTTRGMQRKEKAFVCSLACSNSMSNRHGKARWLCSPGTSSKPASGQGAWRMLDNAMQ